MVVQGLSEVQEAQYQEPTVLLVQRIGGEEDLPQVNICIHLHRASADSLQPRPPNRWTKTQVLCCSAQLRHASPVPVHTYNHLHIVCLMW